MLLVIDSANVKDIRELIEYYPIDGVTTNPSIIIKEKKGFLHLLEDIREAIGNDKELFVQTLAFKAEEIVNEAKFLYKTIPGCGKLVVKIPVTNEGIKAIKLLKEIGIRTMATTIYTPMQGYLAAKAGANYITPYVSRIDKLTGNGANVIKEIAEIIERHNFNSIVLAASFKNMNQVHQALLNGAHGVTVPPDIMRNFVSHPATEENVKEFSEGWEKAFGEKSVDKVFYI